MRPSATESLLKELESKYGEDQYCLSRDMLIRPLALSDLKNVAALEAASFPKDQAASEESIKYRLTACPELCCGIFKREYNWEYRGGGDDDDDDDFENAKSVVSNVSNLASEKLVAIILATQTNNEFVEAQDMEVGGHVEGGRTIALHSLCVAEEYRREHLGHILLIDYIQKFFGLCTADRISLLCRKSLQNLYERVGFKHCGESDVKHGDIEWQNMQLPFDTFDDFVRS